MAAKRSKLCKAAGDWISLGQLININVASLCFRNTHRMKKVSKFNTTTD